MGYVQGWYDGAYHASLYEDVLEPDGMIRVIDDGMLVLAQCFDLRWEFYDDLETDLTMYLASRRESDADLGANVGRFFRGVCSRLR